uniref:HDC04208 n=1 Tax=Drosophila melanogaster TaxID=7227 RepID=Q6IGY9_DROME|nr:TPA_inf: HDC04208 [Drosophila melanogaster]
MVGVSEKLSTDRIDSERLSLVRGNFSQCVVTTAAAARVAGLSGAQTAKPARGEISKIAVGETTLSTNRLQSQTEPPAPAPASTPDSRLLTPNFQLHLHFLHGHRHHLTSASNCIRLYRSSQIFSPHTIDCRLFSTAGLFSSAPMVTPSSEENSSAGAKSTLQSKSPTKLQSQSAEQQPTNYFYRFGCSHKTQQKLQLQTQTQPFHNQMCVFSRPHCGINAQHSPAHTAPISSPTTAQQSQSWSKSQSGSVSGLWTCGRRKCATCCTISN